MQQKKIAILGAGFCGLAVSWHLLNQNPDIRVEIFDPKGIGGEASGIAAGLLHPYTGAHAKLNWHGREGFEATKHLLAVASDALGKPVSKEEGILRLALTPDQREDFARAASLYADITWLDAEACQALAPGTVSAPGILIKSGISVYAKHYLNGLWKSCEKSGAVLYQERTRLNQFQDYSAVVICVGAGISRFNETSHLPFNLIKGQVLELAWPAKRPIPSLPINSHAYLLMNEHQNSCLVGATFERQFTSDQPDLSTAKADILPKLLAFYPGLAEAEIINCYAGLRVSTPHHHPLTIRLTGNTWVLTGMGSKGLLYHALMAEKLAREISSICS